MQTRVCADVNRCGTSESKPSERQDCVMPEICEPGERTCRGNFVAECSSSGTVLVDVEECEEGCLNGQCLEKGFLGGLPTGMFIMLPAMGGLIVVIVMVMLAFYFIRIRK